MAVAHMFLNPRSSMLVPLLPYFGRYTPHDPLSLVLPACTSTQCQRCAGQLACRSRLEACTVHICLFIHWSRRPLVLTAARRRPGGVRQQAKAAIPMVESMLRELKQRPELQGPLQGEVIDQVQL